MGQSWRHCRRCRGFCWAGGVSSRTCCEELVAWEVCVLRTLSGWFPWVRLSLDCPPPQGLLQGPPCHPPWECTPCHVGSRGNCQTARPGPLTVLHPCRGNRWQAKRTVPATASGALAGRNLRELGCRTLGLIPTSPLPLCPCSRERRRQSVPVG